MLRIILTIICMLSVNYALADYVTTTGFAPNYGTYRPSYLNRPVTQTVGTSNYNRYHRGNPRYYGPYINNENLSALEKYAMNRNFHRESPRTRLERLENLAFGCVQEGDIATRYQNVEQAILSRPTNNYKRSLLTNIANYFSGEPTGITPPISQSFMPSYSSPYGTPYYQTNSYNGLNSYPSMGNTRIEQYSNGIFGNGYRIQEGNFGNGSSIRILP